MDKKDFYNIDERRLAAYFEMEWFDKVIEQRRDQDFKTKFPKFQSQALHSEYHEELVQFLSQILEMSSSKPKTVLEIGSSLGRTFYEICKKIDSINIATLVEPSERFFQSFKNIFTGKSPVQFPIIFGYEGTSDVVFDTAEIQKSCSKINLTTINNQFTDLSNLQLHDLVICSNVIDQCEDPRNLVEFLKNVTSNDGTIVLSCTYQWNKKYVDLSNGYITDIKDLFRDGWQLLGERELEYRVRSNERHWQAFQSHAVIYKKTGPK